MTVSDIFVNSADFYNVSKTLFFIYYSYFIFKK